MKVCVIGTGYVGLVSGATFANIGHSVVCVDYDEKKIATLQAGEIPIYEPGLEEIVAECVGADRLSFTTSIPEGMQGADVIFICVGTPSRPDGGANMVYVENVAREIGEHLDRCVVVVEKSTVPVQTGEWIRTILARNNPHGETCDVASNPEFLREGRAIKDSMSPDRIVVGADSERAVEILRDLYEPIIESTGCPFVVTDIRTAELIKHASNAFLATKISFINAVASVCELAGADVRKVAEGMGLDRRIGNQFLSAGAGYGGSCFPKDVRAFIHIASQLGYDFELLKAVAGVNDGQRKAIVKKVEDAVWNLQGKRIAVWGLAFKPDTDDLRNAPALDVVRELVARGAEVVAYDPAAMDKAKTLVPSVRMADDPNEALLDAECLVLMTEWEVFKGADLDKVKELMRHPIVVDGRNMWDRAEMEARGFTYAGVGV